MPKRSTGPKGRIALVHALAHIELYAIDLAWDIIARFTRNNMPNEFYDDWVLVAREEAKVPVEEYKHLLEKYFRGTLKGPFNIDAREKAGMKVQYFEPWLN